MLHFNSPFFLQIKSAVNKNFKLFSIISLDLPSGSDSKESACNAGDHCSFPRSGRSPGGGLGNPLQYSCLENLHGQRNLAGYCPWGSKEADITE